jgi:aspartate kinase
MNILKFGGGILKTAQAIEHLTEIVAKAERPSVIVISALDKTTNNLEDILKEFVKNDIAKVEKLLEKVILFHQNIEKGLNIETDNRLIFDEIRNIISTQTYSGDYDYQYDRMVSLGEIMSSKIVSACLSKFNIENQWVDIRQIIITDQIHREANVDWANTEILARKRFTENTIYVTQGFTGSSASGKTTTLGREGSDFTAAILAYTLNARKVEFWKEVRGIYNADPTKMSDFVFLPKLSYHEAVEQVYYGAKILHPKTIKPLQNKKIQVFVRPFYEPDFTGTEIVDISELSKDFYPDTPIYIIKENQILISISPRDLSFIAEKNMGKIFVLLAKYRIKANLMENTAVSFSICTDDNQHKIQLLLERLKNDFIVRYNKDLSLITVRHYTDAAIERVTADKKIYIEQKSRQTVRFVVK